MKSTSLTDLTAALQRAMQDYGRSDLNARWRINFEARFNVWAGQSPDGRKRRRYIGEEPFPWEGAADSRPPLIDTYIGEDVDMLMGTLYSAQIKAFPIEANDAKKAHRIQNFIRWMLYAQMTELDDEAELLAQYSRADGTAVCGVFWARESARFYEQISMAELEAFVEQLRQIDPSSPLMQLPTLIRNPEMDGQTIDLIEATLGGGEMRDLSAGRVAASRADYRKLIKDLREEGSGRYPVEAITKDRPCVVALREGVDFFAPQGTTDLQSANMLFWREWVNAEQLEERIVSDGYDAAWTRRVIETAKGQTSYPNQGKESSMTQSGRGYWDNTWDTEELYEVWHGFHRRMDASHVPGIWVTTFSAFMQTDLHGNQIVAKDEMLDYHHGQMPFVNFQRERLSRRFADSRGYGEIGYTWQHQVKTEWDSRIDRASITTNPPFLHPVNRPPQKWGPGVQMPYVRRGEFHFADVPTYDRGSQEIEQSVRETAERYFGRQTDKQSPVYPQARMRRMISKWLNQWRLVLAQVFQLCQQFMPEEFYFRVVGTAQGEPIRATREEIQGKFDVSLGYNLLNIMPDQFETILKLIIEVVGSLDVNGIVDRNELMTVAFELLDPNIGERVLRPAEAASMQEVADEKNVFAQLFAGVDVDVQPGQAYQLRAQVLQSILQNNPVAQQRLQQDEHFHELVEKRMKQLQHQVQQQQNALIGKLGA